VNANNTLTCFCIHERSEQQPSWLIHSISSPLIAQQTYALKPYSVALLQLNTAQQSTSATQQAGNIVYNTDEQKVAFHNGSGWNLRF
jgi:hypothetical protein